MAGNYLGVLPMMTSCQLQVIFARNMLSFTVIRVSKEAMLLHTRYSNMWFCIQTKTLFQDILDNLETKTRLDFNDARDNGVLGLGSNRSRDDVG